MMGQITDEYLASHGWVKFPGIMVWFGNPRMGWKPDGTLIVGWREWPEKVTTIEQLNAIMKEDANESIYNFGRRMSFWPWA